MDANRGADHRGRLLFQPREPLLFEMKQSRLPLVSDLLGLVLVEAVETNQPQAEQIAGPWVDVIGEQQHRPRLRLDNEAKLGVASLPQPGDDRLRVRNLDRRLVL